MLRRDFLMAGAALAGSIALPRFPFAQPAAAFTPDGLAGIRAVLQAAIDAGSIPGAVYLLAKGDEVVVETIGTKTFGGDDSMTRDTIFRIASVSKPIAAVGLMILVEEGKVSLDEPVDRLLPELANRQVLTSLDAPLTSTVPAERPILVRDLLTFTLGFGIQFDPALPIQAALTENQLANAEPVPQTPHGPDEWMRRFGTLPLMAQPGERWMYNTGSLIQGVLIARASGQPLEEFLGERIFQPLGMRDTGFWVPAEKMDRFQPLYTLDFTTGAVIPWDTADGQWSAPPPFPSAAGGMVSTADDLLVFARMMMNGGELNGVRILSEESVAEMTRDQLTPEQKAFGGDVLGPDVFKGHGWGYGMRVDTEPNTTIGGNAGRYGWDGGFGTSWANDPESGVIGILLTQSAGYYVNSQEFREFWTAVYGALA